MQRCRALGEALLQVVEFIPPLQGMDEHLARVASNALRLNPAVERLLAGGEGECAGERFVDEELPERLLAGEMLELPADRLAFLEEEGGDQLRFFVRNSKLAGLRGIRDGLVNGDEVEV